MIRGTVFLMATAAAVVSTNAMAEEFTTASLSAEKAIALTQAWAAQRDGRVDQLLKVLDDDKASLDTRRWALVMLEELRAEKAIPWLVKHLDAIEMTGYSLRPRTRKETYPCVGVLIAIGKEASNRAVAALGEENDPLRRELLVDVIEGIEGPEVALLVLEVKRLQFQRANRHDSAKRIEQALRSLMPEWGMEGAGYPVLEPLWFPREKDFEPR